MDNNSTEIRSVSDIKTVLECSFTDTKTLAGRHTLEYLARLLAHFDELTSCPSVYLNTYEPIDLFDIPTDLAVQGIESDLEDGYTPSDVWRRILRYELRSKNPIYHSILKYRAIWQSVKNCAETGYEWYFMRDVQIEGSFYDPVSKKTRRADILIDHELYDIPWTRAIIECGNTPLCRLQSFILDNYWKTFMVFPYELARENTFVEFFLPPRRWPKGIEGLL